MNLQVLKAMIAVVVFAVLAQPVELAAQRRRYKLIDLGTFGGPNAGVNGPGTRDISKTGIYAGEADTSIHDPYAPRNSENGLIDPLLGIPENDAVVWDNGRIFGGGSVSISTASL